jgi:hypothetical protein
MHQNSKDQKATPQIKHRNALGAFKNRVGGDVGDQAWTLDWDIMESAQPLHVGVCTASSTIVFPVPGVLTFVLTSPCEQNTTCPAVSTYQPPDAKLDKVPELLGDSLMPR